MSPSLLEAHALLKKGTMTALQRRFTPRDAEPTVTRDTEGVNCIPAFSPDHDGEACGERVSCQHNIAGTPTATPVTPKKTKQTKCKKESGQA